MLNRNLTDAELIELAIKNEEWARDNRVWARPPVPPPWRYRRERCAV